MNNNKIAAIITSGGSSRRFGSNKLLERLNDKTVIETTISKFINLVDIIAIPCRDDVKEIILKSEFYNKSKIIFASPGSTRQKSVYNGLIELKNKNIDIALIHDGARPFIDKNTIKETINLTLLKNAVIVGKMASDTIKTVENGKIIKTLDRNTIFQAQTPQSFKYDLILKIHEKFKDNPSYTDDSSMAEAYGIDVFIIDNKNKNDKITFKKDLEI